MDRALDTFEQCGDALDRVSHHRAADVVGVIMGHERPGHRHPVVADRGDQIVDRVGRVDEQALAGAAVADGVDEVDHLLGQRVVGGEIAPREQLAEIQIGFAHRPTLALMSTLRYGVIGSGMMGVEHIHNILALDDAIVTAVADPHEPSLERAQQAVGDRRTSRASPTAAELVESGLCDAVVIASPNFTHIDVLRTVLATDLHVLIEKPLCTTLADCREVVDLVRRRSAGARWCGWVWSTGTCRRRSG